MKLNTQIATIMIAFGLSACSTGFKSIHTAHGTANKPMGTPISEVPAYGLITQVSAEEGLVNIKHGPVPKLNWAPMLMTFKTNPEIDLSNFKEGDKVQILLEFDENEVHQIKDLEVARQVSLRSN